jgi:tripartite-type tricarboxylate transporter receptor subunit TctC
MTDDGNCMHSPKTARLTFIAVAVGLTFACLPARAEYPERPVTIVVPYTAGSQTDSVARLIAQALQEKLGQPFLVENKAGASGLVAALAVARAAPDGYTLMVTTNTTHAAAPGLFKNVPYDPVKDFTAIAQIGIFRSVIAVNASSPVRSMGEFVTYAKANPGKLEYGQGNGTTQVVFETMKKRIGIDVVRVPYRSNPAATTDLVAGHIAVAAPDYLNGLPQIKSGRIRPLAVMTKDRSRILPDVPTLDETVMPGFDIEAWVGMFGPAHLPAQIVDTLDRELEQILARAEVKQRFLDSGSEVKWKGPKEFGPFVKDEVVKWTALAREANIQPE